jgi:hypothetical protein
MTDTKALPAELSLDEIPDLNPAAQKERLMASEATLLHQAGEVKLEASLDMACNQQESLKRHREILGDIWKRVVEIRRRLKDLT